MCVYEEKNTFVGLLKRSAAISCAFKGQAKRLILNLSPCGNASCVFVKWKLVSIVPLPLTENMFIMVLLEAGHCRILCQKPWPYLPPSDRPFL